MKVNYSLLLLLSVAFLVSCGDKKTKKEVNLKSSISSSLNEAQEVKKPKQTITYEYAKQIQNEYVKTRANPLNKILNKEGVIKGEDNRDVWFDLEVLEQYIQYVKAESKKKGYKGLGLRVYFATYPNSKEFPDPGYSTVFFMPTHKSRIQKMNFVQQDPNENSEDVDGLNLGHSGRPPKDLN